MTNTIMIEVVFGDALQTPSDVLALKYAQALYGVDALVHNRFTEGGREVKLPPPWGFRFEESVPGIASKSVLFIGVPTLREFGYTEVRAFSRKVLSSLAGKAPETVHVALTLHGAGYGLDEIEAFEAEVAGLMDAIESKDIPEHLSRITFVERNKGRAERMNGLLLQLLPTGKISTDAKSNLKSEVATERLRAAGYASDGKAHVFVAMPFKEEMDDVYHYGIQTAVRAAGFVCERADLSTFTGDVIQWVRTRIKSASFVIADLSEGNPNVYLEVGYAWGCGIPTVLVVKNVDDLKFDVKGQRCLPYRRIKDLEDALTAELARLARTHNGDGLVSVQEADTDDD